MKSEDSSNNMSEQVWIRNIYRDRQLPSPSIPSCITSHSNPGHHRPPYAAGEGDEYNIALLLHVRDDPNPKERAPVPMQYFLLSYAPDLRISLLR